MNTTSPIVVTPAQILSSNSATTPITDLGTRASTRDGREYAYVQAGAAPLVTGNVLQAAAPVVLLHNMVVAAAAAGSTLLSITSGATTAPANTYAGGWLVVSTGAGLGYVLSVQSHAEILSAAAFALLLTSDDALPVALTAASRVDLIANPHKGVIQAPATLTGAVVGVAVYPIAANEYGWAQKRGVGGVLVDGTPAIGQAVSPSGTVPGAAAINAGTSIMLGTMLVTGIGGRVQAVNLNIA